METLHCTRSPKTPIVGRRFCLYLALGILVLPRMSAALSGEASAATAALSEADVIRMARLQSPAGAVANATNKLADARTRTAGLLPNPNVHWDRETVETGPGAGQGSQDIVSATLPIDIVRPRAMRSLVASEGAWLHAEGAMARTDAVLGAVLAYYEVVLTKRRIELLSRTVANLGEAARVLASREAAGSASGYESTRLSIASELSRSHLAQARGALQSARTLLAVLLGVSPESLRVADALALLSVSEDTALALDSGASQEWLMHARESQRLAVEAEGRARWAWLPTLELGGGVKRANNLNSDDGYGYVLGLALSIPIFDRGQALRTQAQAQRVLSTARSEAMRRTVQAEVLSALATFRTAREELERFESETSGQVEALLSAAQSGYREGERSIVDLLDAQSAQTEVAERRLSLLGTAKHAEARLRAAAGDLQ